MKADGRITKNWRRGKNQANQAEKNVLSIARLDAPRKIKPLSFFKQRSPQNASIQAKNDRLYTGVFITIHTVKKVQQN